VVSAVAAQMLSLDPALGPADLVRGLQASARPHVQSALMAACSSDNPGRCLCTTGTCGAGILDADEALRWAQVAAAGQAYQAPSWPQVMIDSSELRAAVALGPDREATAGNSSGSSTGGDSGGGVGASARPNWPACSCWRGLGVRAASHACQRGPSLAALSRSAARR
jgi:serine protease